MSPACSPFAINATACSRWAINATQGQLPISLLTPPIYRKTKPADTPILLISLTSDELPIMTVSDYAYSILAQKLSQVSGVGLVTVGGEQLVECCGFGRVPGQIVAVFLAIAQRPPHLR